MNGERKKAAGKGGGRWAGPGGTVDEPPTDIRYPGKGFRIGEYTIIDTLGHGSMATVFLARDATGHEVAVKIFQEGPGVSATMLERFRREAEASKKLRRHRNIMTIYTTGQDGPYHYIVMESIRNSKTLEDALEKTPMSLPEIVTVIVKIARALQYAHNHRIIHRDVKPTNIMIDEFGEPLLSDFGVAELIDWPSCTLTGALTGTPLYMSPEQARGERVGPASDIFSLGVVLYEALTGVLPHSTQHYAPVKDVLEAVKNEQPRRPRLFRKEISPDLEAVILKALEKDPKDRYVDAEAFASDLDRALAGKRVSAHRFSPLDRMRYGLRRYRQGISAVLVLVLLGGGAWAFFRHKLLHARYVALLRQAQLKSLEYLLSQPDTGTPVSQAPPAWHEIRIARRAMVAGDWRSAADGFRKAVEISRGASDNRTAAIALLEQARCVVLLNDREQARKLYREIIANPDASPSIASFARLEYLGLARLDRAPVDGQMKLPPDFPAEVSVREAINCLVGEMPADRLEAVVAGMPRRFQNDALLAAAIRSNVEGKPAQYQALLRRCIQNSTPAGEWPGPFARQLYMNLPD